MTRASKSLKIQTAFWEAKKYEDERSWLACHPWEVET